MPGYNPTAIEKKWQKIWQDHKIFAAPNTSDKPKFYALDMFPYPSGAGLHVGHPEGYTATDILSRYKRARGCAVMHPMGWDAFGLPAEQYAIKEGVHPRNTTQKNIARFRAQLQAIGFSYDWDREVDTTDPNYYKWTQWIFLQLYDTWFDEKQQKGRPISELIAEFRGGKRPIPAAEAANAAGSANSGGPEGRHDSSPGRKPGVRNAQEPGSPGGATRWDALSPTDQRQIITHFRLAYEAEVPVNWCPGLGTVLANEEVVDGKSEVGGFPVERRPMKQWMLRITAYAQRLLDGLDNLEWSDSLKEMQRNWIGRSEGAEVSFKVAEMSYRDGDTGMLFGEAVDKDIRVFTTRPDTLFGATYMVLSPEHELSRWVAERRIWPVAYRPETPKEWLPEPWAGSSITANINVEAYRSYAASRSDRERQEDTRKTGVFTGLYAINPVNGQKIPIFISDYVLMGYGTGAIMAVPAHDERDHEFATKFQLPIIQVVAPRTADNNRAAGGNPRPSVPPITNQAFTDEGLAINSPWIDGLPTPEAKAKITAMLEAKGLGQKTINYKIRDWLFSRQRYWGEPFPLVHLQDGTTVPLAASELPLTLPELEDFQPTGTIDPPLSKSPQWFNVHVVIDSATGRARTVPPNTPGALPAKRELNTMPQWAGSCWYYLRYLDPKNNTRFVDPAIEKYWLGPKSAQPESSQSAKSVARVEGGVSPTSPCLRASVVNSGGVDLYVGGVEHAVLHLLYSRFWHKVLFDRGLVSCDEPFRRLVNQGLILGEAEYTLFKTAAGATVSLENVVPEFDTRTGLCPAAARQRPRCAGADPCLKPSMALPARPSPKPSTPTSCLWLPVELAARLTYLVHEHGLGLVTGGHRLRQVHRRAGLHRQPGCELLPGDLSGQPDHRHDRPVHRIFLLALGYEPPFSSSRMVVRIRSALSDLKTSKRRTPVVILDEAHLLGSAHAGTTALVGQRQDGQRFPGHAGPGWPAEPARHPPPFGE